MAKVDTLSFGGSSFNIPSCVGGFSSDEAMSRMESAGNSALKEMNLDEQKDKLGMVKSKSIGKGDSKRTIASSTNTVTSKFVADWSTALRFVYFCQQVEKLASVVCCEIDIRNVPEFNAWMKGIQEKIDAKKVEQVKA